MRDHAMFRQDEMMLEYHRPLCHKLTKIVPRELMLAPHPSRTKAPIPMSGIAKAKLYMLEHDGNSFCRNHGLRSG